jgi:hypothetical protein
MIMLSQAEHARSQQVGGVRRFLEPRKPDAKPAAQGCGRQIQPVEACVSMSSANSSEGFFQLWILRGRSLISEATIVR